MNHDIEELVTESTAYIPKMCFLLLIIIVINVNYVG